MCGKMRNNKILESQNYFVTETVEEELLVVVLFKCSNLDKHMKTTADHPGDPSQNEREPSPVVCFLHAVSAGRVPRFVVSVRRKETWDCPGGTQTPTNTFLIG